MARRHGKRQDRNRLESDLGERIMIGATPTTIGDDLRAARQAQGEDLYEIARQLRIRGVYLEAIENGAFDSLPGPTYAIGFVRAYARYLGLDAEQMIRRFKEEAAGIESPADLYFPEPVSESRVPRSGLVIIAILLALGAYAGWYYLSTKDLTVATDVPPAPGMMSGGSETPEALAELTPVPRDEAPSPEASTPAESPADTAAQPDAQSPAQPPVAEAPSAAPALPPTAPFSPPPQAATPQAAAPQAVAPQAAAPQSAPQAAPAPTAAPQAAPAIPAVPDVAQAPSASGEQPAEAAPRVYGEGQDSRVTLQARGDSWIQVRAADDSLILTRTLRAGDSYRVPNQPGLKLMTGNAGALDIIVDGQTMPSLGPFGAVRRNVALDPERLKAGGGTAAN